jgi:hypothetical protein
VRTLLARIAAALRASSAGAAVGLSRAIEQSIEVPIAVTWHGYESSQNRCECQLSEDVSVRPTGSSWPTPETPRTGAFDPSATFRCQVGGKMPR